MKKIVTVGGGTGSYTLLRGLKKYNDLDITAIVSMADDGGSTGRLRDELGVLPSGDVRQCLVALSEHTDIVRALMNYRFQEGGLAGHSFGNIFLAALEKVAGSFVHGVEVASEILKIKGRVVPVTEDNAKLAIKLDTGEILLGEDSIYHSNLENKKVSEIYFQNSVSLSEHARNAIIQADVIILGPGDFYCSILPNLIVSGFKEAILSSPAKILVPVNLTNKKGQTTGWKTSDYIHHIEHVIGKPADCILINSTDPSEEQISLYKLEEGDGVLVTQDMQDTRIIKKDLLSHEIISANKADSISSLRGFIRHDSDKIAKAIFESI
jgi:uncharacterized cofD-like protein